MYAIEEQQWGQANVHTWEQLTQHQWMCFRIALADTLIKLESQGVRVDYSKVINETLVEMEVQGVNVEHSPVIIQDITEMIVNIIVSKRDYLSAMISYLPWYERSSRVFIEILRAYDKEFRKIEQELEVVERNTFIDTAIELLHIYERDLGIQARDDLQYDQRREQISSRYRAAFDQTTEETIKNVAVAFSNGDVEVNKTDTPGVYEIKFVGTKGIPDNLDGLKEALNIIIPAHLALTYTFTYNVWDFVSKLTWGDCLDKTWDELRTWNEVS